MHLALLLTLLVNASSVLLGAIPGVADSPRSAPTLPFLAPIFGDHMVLQRGKPNTLWGWDEPGAKVIVTVGEHSAETVAGTDGRWSATVAVPPAGGPYTVRVDGREHVKLTNVLVGDVWLCSGQSNMEWPLENTFEADAELARAEQPEVRLYSVAKSVAYAPASTAFGAWQACSPNTAAGFSAVAYYFARKLQAELNVPIGVIQAAAGGSPAESWMSADALARIGEFAPQMAEIARLTNATEARHGSFLMHWLDEHDVGGRGEAWAQPAFDDRAWHTVTIPGGFAELGVPAAPAVVWFRREVTLPDPVPAGAGKVFFGVIERMDTIYVNGRWIGASSWVENPRVYTIPSGALKPGKNVIAVRVFKTQPDGGFRSPAATLRVQLGDGREIPLAGEWRAAVSYDARPPATLPLDFDNYPTMPTVLYNGMIAPLAPLAISGAIWYQGEANSSRAPQYRKLLPALIADWRAAFGQGEFPFYIVSLPAFMARKREPGLADGWTELREAQALTAREVRNTGLAITIDTGEADNIHPRLKRPVGERLALRALADHYRRDVVASGPTLRFVERRPGALALHFDHVAGGLQVRGERLGEFAVAGDDGRWHWAEARIEGPDVVVLTAAEVPSPAVARYAWQANPLATLFNGAGLPAAPFRTNE
ncbi:MAG TPA: sialate O-acetylesterase [Opitutaceae bacterium]